MNKIALVLTGLLATGFVAIRMFNVRSENPTEWVEHQRRGDEKYYRYHVFKRVFQRTLDLLEAGTIDLKTAQSQVLAESRWGYPEYLKHLYLFERGASDKERVARNLIGHLHLLAEELKPHLRSRVEAFKVELQELLDQREH